MKSYSFNFSNSYDSKRSKTKEYKVSSSDPSSSKNFSLEIDELFHINKKHYRDVLDIVDEDNEMNVKFLAKFLRKEERNGISSYSNDSSILSLISPTAILLCICAWIWISVSLWLTKFIFSEKRLTMWEDIYGKSIVGSIISYIVITMRKESPLNISVQIRTKLFFMIVCFILAFCLAVMSLQYLSALSVWAILINFYGYKKRALMVIWAIGIIMLADPFNLFRSCDDYTIPSICLGICLICLISGKVLWDQIQQHISAPVGVFHVNFWMMMFIPSFMIVAFSIETKTVNYSVHDLSYFILNGTFTWLAIYLFVQAIKFDKNSMYGIVSISSIVIIGILQIVYYIWKDSKSEVEIMQDTSSLLDSPTSDIQSTGDWEYFPVIIMLGFRLIFEVISLIKEYKSRKSLIIKESSGILDDI